MKAKYMIYGVLFFMMVFLVSCNHNVNQDSDENNDNSVSSDVTQTVPENDQEKVENDIQGENQEEPEVPEVLHIMTGDYHESNWDDELNVLLSSAKYSEIRLDSCCEEKYPELANAVTDSNITNKENILEEYEQLSEQASVDANENIDDFQTYKTDEAIHVRRADSKVLSLLYSDSYYGGGVHGDYYKTGKNFDVKTGKELLLTDVLTDINTTSEIIKTQLYKSYSSDDFFSDFDIVSYFTENYENISWVLDYHGITFYFNPYEIGPFATGIVTVTVANSEYPDAVKPEYQNIPENYAVELTLSDKFYYDIDGNSFLDEISVTAHMSEYDMYEKYVVMINNNVSEIVDYAYNIEPVLIHTFNDKNYLYVQITRENDWREIIVYDVSDGSAMNKRTITAGWRTELVDTEEYLVLEKVLTDPTEFELETRTDVLSTVTGYMNYHISDTGFPETDDKWYTLSNQLEFTLLQPLEANIVDEVTGEETSNIMLQEGSEVIYLRTDNQSFADLKLENGTIVRIQIEYDGWPITVNGVDIDDVFEGLRFAG